MTCCIELSILRPNFIVFILNDTLSFNWPTSKRSGDSKRRSYGTPEEVKRGARNPIPHQRQSTVNLDPLLCTLQVNYVITEMVLENISSKYSSWCSTVPSSQGSYNTRVGTIPPFRDPIRRWANYSRSDNLSGHSQRRKFHRTQTYPHLAGYLTV